MSETLPSHLPSERIERLSLPDALAVFRHIAAMSDEDVAAITSAKALQTMGNFTAALVEVFPTIALLQNPINPWTDINLRGASISEDGAESPFEDHHPHLNCETAYENIRHTASIGYHNLTPGVFPSQEELARRIQHQTPVSFSLDSYVDGNWNFSCYYTFQNNTTGILVRIGNNLPVGYNLTTDRLTVPPSEKEEAFTSIARGTRTAAQIGLYMYENIFSSLPNTAPNLLLIETN